MTFELETIYSALRSRFGERVRRDELLSRHSTFGVGGPADIWITLDSRADLTDLVMLCANQRWPLLVVGNGTNLLFADAGVSWPRLLNELAMLGWGGLEFGPGIPGTLGGGVISNAGAHGSNLGEVLAWVEAVDARHCIEQAGEVPVIRRYQHADLDLAYRHSRFRAERRIQFDERGYPLAAPHKLIEPSEIVIQVGVRLHREEPEKLRAIIEDHKQHRKRTQPPQQSAGSVFKNPPGDYSGRLIEAAGLKGLTRGKARISERHANFIVNVGGASAADVAALIMEAHNRVHERFGVDLELEVELRGEWRKP